MRGSALYAFLYVRLAELFHTIAKSGDQLLVVLGVGEVCKERFERFIR